MNNLENDNLLNIDNLDIEYFMHYKITENKIINTLTNQYYYISSYCEQLRANQYVIDYIFERTLMKLFNNNEYTPYFYNALFQVEINKFANEIPIEEAETLIELEHTKQKDILDFVPDIITVGRRYRQRQRQNNNNIINIKNNIYFYKNGFKQNDSYYKFKFNMNITKDNLYQIINSIDENILDNILFDDINNSNTSLTITKINKIYEWKISEYDGLESLKLNLPIDSIIDDLLNNIWKTKDYKNKSILTELLINKNLNELRQNMYD